MQCVRVSLVYVHFHPASRCSCQRGRGCGVRPYAVSDFEFFQSGVRERPRMCCEHCLLHSVYLTAKFIMYSESDHNDAAIFVYTSESVDFFYFYLPENYRSWFFLSLQALLFVFTILSHCVFHQILIQVRKRSLAWTPYHVVKIN